MRTEDRPVRTHDYRKQQKHWGHDVGYELLPGDALRAYGWGPDGGGRLMVGDYVLLSYPDGGDTRYQVREVRYMRDPPDQWFATLDFAPRDSAGAEA